ncbi:MAG: prenyltransferase [Candidatus Omnitrophica bacterium]|nr:prenyltransferase [Candidatus Omnitrophota bacterium]MBL7151912.1 prenyltransferase [Candidatus Omnitrophota bacterium]
MARQTKSSPAVFIRALRLPFAGASLLPFIFGSLINRGNFGFLQFGLGFIAVLSTHLSANLINDYADSKSGADWQDKSFFGLFGGSKLIQEGAFSERFYLRGAQIFACISILCVICMAVALKSPRVIIYYAVILGLAWSYSHKPLQLSYRRTGEPVIFVLFGPALVMGGYFLQTGIFPDLKSFMLSLPFGFFTTAVLFANEIPDFSDDKKAGKFTWVNFLGSGNSYLLYCTLVFMGFFSILTAIALGYLSWTANFSFLLIIPAVKSALILRRHSDNKRALVEASKLTIAVQTLVSIILIFTLLL